MAQFNLPEAWTITGNKMSDSQNAVLSVLEAQIRGELTSDKSTMFLRLDATDEQIIEMAGVAFAIYRLIARVLWGSEWDSLTGTKRQKGETLNTELRIDDIFTIDFNIEEFDIERFLKEPENIGVGMVTNWTASFTRNLYENLELTFLQGATDYAIAKSLVLPIDLINLTPEKAVEAYYTIWAKNNKLIKKVDSVTVGINKSDLIGATGIDSNLGLSKAFVRLNYGQIAADTIVTGRRYTSNIAGMEFWESFFLEQNFNAKDQTAMHLERSYSLLNIHGFVTHRRMWAMPMSFTKIRSHLADDTDNIRIIGKCLHAKPAAIRPDLEYVIRPTMPTVSEIEEARKKDKLTNPTNKDVTYQSCRWDNLKTLDLRNIIYFNNLGTITIAGEIPTSNEIATAIVNAGNVGFEKDKADITDITANSATINPKDKTTDYYSQVIVKFTKKTSEITDIKPNNNEIQTELIKQLGELQKQTGKSIDVLTNVVKENKELKNKLEILETNKKDKI